MKEQRNQRLQICNEINELEAKILNLNKRLEKWEEKSHKIKGLSSTMYNWEEKANNYERICDGIEEYRDELREKIAELLDEFMDMGKEE
uniref:Putative transcriptional coactivator n=1 Tax=viral metagenome TaxID=1070528 RepID=A0A6M3M594_9ZZZZ